MKLKNDASKILPMMTAKWEIRFFNVTNMKYDRHVRSPVNCLLELEQFSLCHLQCIDYEEHNSLSSWVRHRVTEICNSY